VVFKHTDIDHGSDVYFVYRHYYYTLYLCSVYSGANIYLYQRKNRNLKNVSSKLLVMQHQVENIKRKNK